MWSQVLLKILSYINSTINSILEVPHNKWVISEVVEKHTKCKHLKYVYWKVFNLGTLVILNLREVNREGTWDMNFGGMSLECIIWWWTGRSWFNDHTLQCPVSPIVTCSLRDCYYCCNKTVFQTTASVVFTKHNVIFRERNLHKHRCLEGCLIATTRTDTTKSR